MPASQGGGFGFAMLILGHEVVGCRRGEKSCWQGGDISSVQGGGKNFGLQQGGRGGKSSKSRQKMELFRPIILLTF